MAGTTWSPAVLAQGGAQGDAPRPGAVPAGPTAAGALSPSDDPRVWSLALLPNTATATVLAQYDPLRRYLERLNAPQRVHLQVPSSFKAFFDGMWRGDFDLAVAAPHFARVLQLERGWVPLASQEPRIDALMAVPLDSAATQARELKGRVIALANPQSLVAMYALQWLRQQSMEPGRDFELRSTRSDLGVGRMVLVGEADAAVLSSGEFRALPPEEAARLRILSVFARLPNFIVMANARLDRDRVARLKAQLKTFASDREDGHAFVRNTGLSGLAEVDEAMLRELDPFVGQTRRAMGLAS